MSAHTDAWQAEVERARARYEENSSPFRLGYWLGCAPKSTPRSVEPGRLDVEAFEELFGANPRPFGLADNRPAWRDFLSGWRSGREAEAAFGE